MTNISLSSIRVLIVDDSTYVRQLLRAILKSMDIRSIFEAEDGGEALEMLGDHEVDVVMADLDMKPMDGLEFARQVRASAGMYSRRLPIIMVTSHTERSWVVAARDVGINEFIAKPFNAAIVAQRLHAALNNPRHFIQAGDYVGPDRRRHDEPARGTSRSPARVPERRKARLATTPTKSGVLVASE